MGGLKDFQRKNSKFIKLEDGESFTGKYNGYSFSMNTMTGKEVPVYKFIIDGQEKLFQTQSGKMCAFFDEDSGSAKKGQMVKITRKGLAMQTSYEPELIINDNDLGPSQEVPF